MGEVKLPNGKSRRKYGVAALALSVALVGGAVAASGDTMANWIDQASVATGAVINSGNLDIAALGSPTWTYSDGSTATGGTSPRNLIPGETFYVSQPFDYALKGDKMVARYNVRLTDASGQNVTAPAGWTMTYRVLGSTQEVVSDWRSVGSATTVTITPASVPPTLDGEVNYYLKVKVVSPTTATSFPYGFSASLEQV